MNTSSNSTFAELVEQQVQMLSAGRPLDAFDRFFASAGKMYANDEIFAKDANEGRRKQEPFIASAKAIRGVIVDLHISEANEICVFRNQTSFEASDGRWHQIDGLCWQQWCNGRISEERYYDGEKMRDLISIGILSTPEAFRNGLRSYS
ncbi:hypothetical protein [Ruegeria sp. EL01]|jgi:hypothetical protein|uniref:hypothetical protein n=1 Tax=Ruegeria sp. EL01 TaxID=2107578 RepID=UPI0013C45445|nr:hypothetical protein [Ruegeria sp. EL01]